MFLTQNHSATVLGRWLLVCIGVCISTFHIVSQNALCDEENIKLLDPNTVHETLSKGTLHLRKQYLAFLYRLKPSDKVLFQSTLKAFTDRMLGTSDETPSIEEESWRLEVLEWLGKQQLASIDDKKAWKSFLIQILALEHPTSERTLRFLLEALEMCEALTLEEVITVGKMILSLRPYSVEHRNQIAWLITHRAKHDPLIKESVINFLQQALGDGVGTRAHLETLIESLGGKPACTQWLI